MAGNFFGGQFFGGGFFGAVSTTTVKTGTGGIDPPRKKLQLPVKPTGFTAKSKRVQERLEETQRIAEEVAREAKQAFTGEQEVTPEFQVPGKKMNLMEIESEISTLVRKKQLTEDEEVILLILLAASA